MTKNVQRALAVELQDLSTAFRASQNAYLKRAWMHAGHLTVSYGVQA